MRTALFLVALIGLLFPPAHSWAQAANQFTYSGSAWEPERSNRDAAALVTLTAAGAGTTNSADQANASGRGAIVVVDITVAGGTPTLTVTIQGKDAASGKYYDILTSTALATVATTALVVYPGITAAANLKVDQPLPRVWRVKAVVAGSTPAVTATVGAAVLR